jgi:hypothetical protein
MSIGNLKTYGNKGHNFPFQLAVLKGLDLAKTDNITEIVLNGATADALETAINGYLATVPGKYLVSKSVIYDSATPEFVAFLSVATL